MQYPIILSPIKDINKVNVSRFLEEPIEPIKPTKPELNESDGNAFGCTYIILALGPFMILGIVMTDAISDQENIIILISTVLAMILSLGILMFKSEKNKEIKKRYLLQHEIFEERLKEYNRNYNNYLDLLSEYNQEMMNLENPAYREKTAKRMIKEELAKAIPPETRIKKSQKGNSEDYFLNYLNKYFPGYISNNVVLDVRNIGKLDTLQINSFEPDFAFICREKNIYIDIEIDEPYEYNTGEPIHYRGFDDFRNHFFLGNGWFVIRFSEKQIVQFPKSCCKKIAFRIYRIYPEYFKEIWESLKHENNLNPDNSWDKSEAIKLAAENYRNSYLAKKML